MAKKKKDLKSTLGTVAETVGRALGTVVGKAEAIAAAHPDPIGEAREFVADGQKKVGEAKARASEVISATTRRVATTRTPAAKRGARTVRASKAKASRKK